MRVEGVFMVFIVV